MKFTDNAKAALQHPDTRTQAFEMTPERKEKFKKASSQIVDVIKQHTGSPAEAYLLLLFITESLGECYGIRGGIIMNEEDTKAQD